MVGVMICQHFSVWHGKFSQSDFLEIIDDAVAISLCMAEYQYKMDPSKVQFHSEVP